MFERFTPEARNIVVGAQQQARRLGHRYVGCEHLLLAVTAADAPASAVLRDHGLTPDRVTDVILQHVGLGAGAGLFTGLDRDALATIGVDLDAVRARIEASFGPEALTRASRAMPGGTAGRRLPPKPARLLRRWWRRRHEPARVPSAQARQRSGVAGRESGARGVASGWIPFTPRAKKLLVLAADEAKTRHDPHVGAEHCALAVAGMTSGMAPVILAALGVSAPELRTAITRRYRQAS
jgi:hypothetical protein